MNISDGCATLDEAMGTLGARSGGQEVGAQTRGVVLTVDKQGAGVSRDVAPTLKTDLAHQMGPVVAMASGQANAEIVKDGEPSLTAQHDGPPITFQGVGIPRRLMPIECERLMGWPDHWTRHGVAEDGTRYALSDTARYRLCGNGVASPVAAWIGFRLRWALEGYDHP